MATTWRKEINAERTDHGDHSDVEGIAPEGLDLDREFDDGYGGAEGDPFTLWTVERVYFPAVYDGSEWVRSVPRSPCNEATFHVGGQ